MKIRFSVRLLLAFMFVCAAGLALVITPRLKRQRFIEELENEPSVGFLTTDDRSLVDRLLRVDGPIDYLWLRPRGISDNEKDVLTKEAFELVWQASPLQLLDVTDAHVERCKNYPVAEDIRISNVTGEEADDWLRGLLLAQDRLKTIQVESVPSFSDDHLAILSRIEGLSRIWLDDTPVTGVGFQELSKHNSGVEVSVYNCPITDEGLRTIVECTAIVDVVLDFSGLDCQSLPDLRLLLRAPRSRFEWIQLGDCWDDPELAAIAQEINEYFGDDIVL